MISSISGVVAAVLLAFFMGQARGAEADSSRPQPRMSEAQAKRLAREAVTKIVPVPDTAEISVARYPKDSSGVYLIRLKMDLPANAFSLREWPEVEVESVMGKTYCWAWSDEMDGASMANPATVTQCFLNPSGKNRRDPERARRLIKKWMDANRGRSDYDAGQDYAYQALVTTVRFLNHPDDIKAALSDDQPAGLEEALKEELAKKPGAWAKYAIRHELSKLYCRQKRYAEALEQMQKARDELKDESGPILTTRHSLAIREIGLIHKASGNIQQAVETLEDYLNSPIGQGNVETIQELGDLYEQAQTLDKAKALYEKIIATPFPNAANPKYIEREKDKFRVRLERVKQRDGKVNPVQNDTKIGK